MTPEELRRKAKDDEFECLQDPLFLEAVFIPWYTMGGAQRGLSYQEIVSMPATHRHDFSYVMGVISDERDMVERFRKKKPKPGRRH